jgi:transcriptional regulator with XRE-family HTH domain
MELGLAFKSHRKIIGATLKQIADKAKMDKTTLSRFERGEVIWPDGGFQQLQRIANAMSTTVTRLVATAEAAVEQMPDDPDATRLLWLFQRSSPKARNLIMGAVRAMTDADTEKNKAPTKQLAAPKRKSPPTKQR